MSDSDSQAVYLNGQFVQHREAKIDVEERGLLFGEGVYEVTRYYNGLPLAMEGHIGRLRRSLAAVGLSEPDDLSHFAELSNELMARNALRDGVVYWQISAGVAPRTQRVVDDVKPTVVMISYPAPPVGAPEDDPPTVTAVLAEDIRWGRCDIKSLMLLPSVMAQRDARRVEADTAILHRGDTVTESTSANIFIVRSGELLTHPADHHILNGISRQIVIQLARDAGLKCLEESFTTSDLLSADEVLICGTTTHIGPVVRIGTQPIHHGVAGPVARRLHRVFIEYVRKECLKLD